MIKKVNIFHDKEFTANPRGKTDPKYENLEYVGSFITNGIRDVSEILEDAYARTQNGTAFDAWWKDPNIYATTKEGRSTSCGDLLEYDGTFYVVSAIGIRELAKDDTASNSMAVTNQGYYCPLIANLEEHLLKIDKHVIDGRLESLGFDLGKLDDESYMEEWLKTADKRKVIAVLEDMNEYSKKLKKLQGDSDDPDEPGDDFEEDCILEPDEPGDEAPEPKPVSEQLLNF